MLMNWSDIPHYLIMSWLNERYQKINWHNQQVLSPPPFPFTPQPCSFLPKSCWISQEFVLLDINFLVCLFPSASLRGMHDL